MILCAHSYWNHLYRTPWVQHLHCDPLWYAIRHLLRSCWLVSESCSTHHAATSEYCIFIANATWWNWYNIITSSFKCTLPLWMILILYDKYFHLTAARMSLPTEVTNRIAHLSRIVVGYRLTHPRSSLYSDVCVLQTESRDPMSRVSSHASHYRCVFSIIDNDTGYGLQWASVPLFSCVAPEEVPSSSARRISSLLSLSSRPAARRARRDEEQEYRTTLLENLTTEFYWFYRIAS